MLHGPVMVDLRGTTLTDQERELLMHPATGGVILFSRNYASPQQLYRLVETIHELRSPPLLIAVDQEGGRVQRFREGLTRLPPPAAIHSHFADDLEAGIHAARELGWLMAAELRALGVDFSFAPVLDLDYAVSEVIGDRAFAREPQLVSRYAQAWMGGAREAGMISVGKHFPGHGGVAADSHEELPVDERDFDTLLAEDLQPFVRMIDSGLEAVMPAHVVYAQCDDQPAGFSHFWLQEILRERLGFQGVIFSDDLDMAAAGQAGGFAARAEAALKAGCDTILVCNNPDGAREVLSTLRDYHDPVAQSRTIRLHGRPSPSLTRLREDARWRDAVALAGRLVAQDSLDLELPVEPKPPRNDSV